MQSHHLLDQSTLLPSPTLTLTIPSLHDGSLLSCRVYHPTHSLPHDAHPHKRAAILTHPYAPLGGCQDDPVLDAVGSTLLSLGYIIGTLDLRGAGSSQGRTSWTGKPEGQDLASFAGFMTYYMHFLTVDDEMEIPHEQKLTAKPLLLFAGYSFGAHITSITPPLGGILSVFHSPLADSHAAQIRLRAEALAAQHNVFTAKLREEQARSQEPTSPSRHVRVGGDEGSRPRGGSVRKSNDVKHRRIPSLHETEEKLKRRVSLILHRPAPQKQQQSVSPPPAHGCLPPVADLVTPSSAYVLISRPHGILSHLLTLTLLPTALTNRRQTPEEAAAERKLVEDPTLMVFGSADGMFPVGKSRAVAQRLESMSVTEQGRNMFRSREVEGAGHFWLEVGAMQQLTQSIEEFASGILIRSDS